VCVACGAKATERHRVNGPTDNEPGNVVPMCTGSHMLAHGKHPAYARNQPTTAISRVSSFLGSACKNSQFYRLQQPCSMTVRPKESMTPKHKENNEFAKWVRDWIAVIQQNRDPVEGRLSEKTAHADKQEYSDGTCLLGPKLRAESGRFAA